jgi:hypothetical protein
VAPGIPGKPWINMTRGPCPASATRRRMPLVSIFCRSDPMRLLDPIIAEGEARTISVHKKTHG